MEGSHYIPTAALYLELGILPIKCEIAIRQLLFLKKILDKNENNPVSQVYPEMIKYEFENNWARNFLNLRVKYSLPLNDENVGLLSKGVWKSMVKKQVKTYAFSQLLRNVLTIEKHDISNLKHFIYQPTWHYYHQMLPE